MNWSSDPWTAERYSCQSIEGTIGLVRAVDSPAMWDIQDTASQSELQKEGDGWIAQQPQQERDGYGHFRLIQACLSFEGL